MRKIIHALPMIPMTHMTPMIPMIVMIVMISMSTMTTTIALSTVPVMAAGRGGSEPFSGEAASAEAEKIQPVNQPVKRKAEEVKILITADQVEFDPQNEIATYTGNVVVRQENAYLYAERIEVHFIAKGKGIELIKAFGNIKVTQEDRMLTAEEGIYYQQGRKVILTGNPTTRQGENCITGDKITYFWDEGRAIVEGNVKATIIMDKEKIDSVRPK